MRAAFIRWFLILVFLALFATTAIAQSPTPEATPSPAPTATPIPQATGPTRIGSFDWSNLADFATVLGILILGSMSAYLVRVLRPMQRREVELLERELECEKREKEAVVNVLRQEKEYLDIQLRDAKEKANIPHDATLPPQPVPLDPKDRQTLQQILNRLESMESVGIAAGAEMVRPDPWKYISDGNLHFNLQQYEQAIQKYNQALELKPDFSAALNNRGRAYLHLHQYEHAIQDFNKALQLKPDYPMALNNRGLAYRHLGQHERAIQDYDKALELKPDYPEALNNRAVAYLHLGQHERAIQDLNTALEVEPDFPGTRYNMACLYSLMNKPDEALKWLREAIDLDEKLVEQAKTDSDFDNIRDDPRFKKLVGE